jgi:hypothetical protein
MLDLASHSSGNAVTDLTATSPARTTVNNVLEVNLAI